VHVAYGRGSVLPRRGDEIPSGRGKFWGFSSPLTMLAAKGSVNIDREGVMGVHSAGEV